MTQIFVPEFRNELESTRYPFSDVATLLASDGVSRLPLDAFLDASLYPITGNGGVYLAQIVVAADAVQFVLGAAAAANVATGTFDPRDPPAAVALTDAWGRPAGLLVSDAARLARFGTWNYGTYSFTPTATPFAATCVIPTPERGVRGVLVAPNTLLTGDIWLVGDNGVVVTAADADDDYAVIRVDITGDPLFVRQLCGRVDRFAPEVFLRTINSCPADAYGNYHLVVDDHLAAETVIRIYPTAPDALRIEAAGQTLRE